MSIIAPPNLTGLVNNIHGRWVLNPLTAKITLVRKNMPYLVNLKGLDTARYVFEIAPAGGHHLLTVGASGAGNLTEGDFIQNRLFREPHYSASMVALHARSLVEFPWRSSASL